MLIREYIQNSLKGIHPPEEVKNIAVILCRDILGLNQLDIYLGKYINLSEEKKELLENSLSRLCRHEPIQYVVGKTEFMGLTFHIFSGILIPRPETEEMTALIISEAQAPGRILDLGSGSGCIAITLARHFPDAEVYGWDISEVALEIATDNNRLLGTNVVFCRKDILEDDDSAAFDIIVSNPPYITEKERKDMDKNVLDWEPEGALFVPDDDPLLFYRRIAEIGRTALKPDGKLYFEINRAYGNETADLLESMGYSNVRLIKDIYGNDRIIAAAR